MDDVVLTPSGGNDTLQLWTALERVKGSGRSVILEPGVYKVDNTLNVEGATLRGRNLDLTARTDIDDGFAIIEPDIRNGTPDQPVVQLLNGNARGFCIRWTEAVPESRRNTGIKAAAKFEIETVKIVGAQDAIVTGDVYSRGAHNTGAFKIRDCYLLHNQEVGLRIARSKEWSTVENVQVRFAKIGIDLEHNDDLLMRNIFVQGRHEAPAERRENQFAIRVRRGTQAGDEKLLFCSAEVHGLFSDAFQHLMLIEGDADSNGQHHIRIVLGRSATHHAAVKYLAAQCVLFVQDVWWKGNTDCAVQVHPDIPSGRSDPFITLQNCQLEFPGGARGRG